jgi:putative CocE/NonD family hydrolase
MNLYALCPNINLAKDVMVSMRDGTRLATDIYRPAGPNGKPLSGRFPTILCRTPYNKTDRRYTEIADYLTLHCYVTVLQDLRGRYRSEGVGQYHHVANDHDGTDGYDTIEWIARQRWSNKRVGMVGSSFAGLVQTRAALERPHHLASIWPDVCPTNSYHHQAREGGAMQLHMFWALFMHAHDALEIKDDPEAQQVVWDGLRDMRRWVESFRSATPLKPGETPLRVVPNLERILFDYYYRGTYDEFWARECNDFERHFARHAEIPCKFTGGWFDPFAVAMCGHFEAMRRQNSKTQHLRMGPWTHVAMRGDASWVGDVDFGRNAVWGVSGYFDFQLRWFDRWLKGLPSKVENDSPVNIFVMGGGSGRRTPQGKLDHGGRWREEWEWPLARTRYTPFYLHHDGLLSPELPGSDAPPRRYTFDPEHPVPTIGGNLCGIMELPPETGDLDPMWRRFISPVARLRHIVTTGPAHQKEEPHVFGARPPYPLLADRPDVLVFRTPPLPEPVEVTGPVVVKLWISSSAVDTDFTAKLIDEYPPSEDYPDGYHMNLVDSVIRTRYRNGWEREEFMESGSVYAVEIRLQPTSNLFAAGHCIRLDVSSSNFPRLDVNPNSGEPVGRHTHLVKAVNTVYVDRERASQVVLPIIPAS